MNALATRKKPSIVTLRRWTSIAEIFVLVLLGTPSSLLGLVGVDAKTNFTLENLGLKTSRKERANYPVQVLQSGIDNVETIRDVNGNEYDLSQLKPFVGLFSENTFTPSSDNSVIVDKRTSEVIRVSIYKAVYEDGSTILMEKDANNNIEYVEVRRPAEQTDTFLVPTQDGESAAFLAFTSEDIDYETLQSKYNYAEASHIGGKRYLSHPRTENNEVIHEFLMPSLKYRQGKTEFETSSFTSYGYGQCDSFTIVKLAIIFDGNFCSIHGGFEAARRRIMTIVASASFHYERDMCVQLQLSDISTCLEGPFS